MAKNHRIFLADCHATAMTRSSTVLKALVMKDGDANVTGILLINMPAAQAPDITLNLNSVNF